MIRKGIVPLVVFLTVVLCGAFASATPDNDQVTVKYYTWFNQDLGAKSIAEDVAAFEEIYPNVIVEPANIVNDAYWDRLTLDIVSKVEGDVVQIETAGITVYNDLRPGGAFLPLEEYINTFEMPDGTDLATDILGLDLMKRNGKILALPYDQLLFANIGYRPSQLAAAGLTPEDLSTWQGFLSAARKMTIDTNGDGKNDQFGYAHPLDATPLARWWHMHWLWTAGGGIFKDELPPYDASNLVFNSPENVYAVTFLKQLIDAAGPPGERGALEDLEMFDNGAVSTFMIATWTLGSIKDAAPDIYNNDFDFVPFPTLIKDGQTMPPIYVAWGTPVAVSSISKHPDEAFAFAAYLHTVDSQQRRALIGHTPVNRRIFDWYAEGNPDLGKYVDMAAPFELRQFPDIPEKNQVDSIVQEAIQAALLGLKTPQEALDDGQEQLANLFK